MSPHLLLYLNLLLLSLLLLPYLYILLLDRLDSERHINVIVIPLLLQAQMRLMRGAVGFDLRTKPGALSFALDGVCLHRLPCFNLVF